MKVELLTIGDELLLGLTLDTNAVFLARELSALGIQVVQKSSVGDDPEAITAAVRDALARSDGVITSGGLGPTSDDVTKPAVAAALGKPLVRNESVVRHLEEIWKARGRSGPLPAANLQQAMLPEGAGILANAHGTAPGIFAERADGKWVALLPGVPRELRSMCADALRPLLATRAGSASVIRSVTVRTTGIAESQLPDLLGDLASGVDGMPLAYLPSTSGVDLRLTVRGFAPDAADALLARGSTALRARLGQYAYGDGEADLADVVIAALRARNVKLAVAESCTGGMLGMRLTSVPGASAVFMGGVIAYDDSVKQRELGVAAADLKANGAVSEVVAVAMARATRVRFATDIGVAITGIAGPSGGTAEKPVGTVWVAMADADAATTRTARLPGDRQEIRIRATQIALDVVRRKLAG